MPQKYKKKANSDLFFFLNAHYYFLAQYVGEIVQYINFVQTIYKYNRYVYYQKSNNR